MTAPIGPPLRRVRPRAGQLLDVALAHAARGWAVFPVAENSKQPAIRSAHPAGDPLRGVCRGQCGRSGHGAYDATTDPERIRRWPGWTRGRDNIGIATGASGLLVVDLDTPKHPQDVPPPAWALPGVIDGADVFAYLCARAGQPFPWPGAPHATHTVGTARGGMHLYYARPELPDGTELGCTTGDRGHGLGWHIDTRGAGGYVLAAGSVVEGREYLTEHDTQPLPLPAWITTALSDAQARHLPGGHSAGDSSPGSNHFPRLPRGGAEDVLAAVRRRAAYAEAALRTQVGHVLASRPGERNHVLFAASAALGELVVAGLLPRALTEQALITAALQVGPNETKITKTVQRGLEAGARATAGRHLP